MALLLDLANIFGGFLLSIALLRMLPRVGDDLSRFAARVAPFGWIVGVVALVAGGFYLIMHMISGPHVFHFEVVGIGVGLALLWDRLRGRTGTVARRETSPVTHPDSHLDSRSDSAATRTLTAQRSAATGAALLLAIFGIIAIVVGIQGLFTPD
jgi:hypothetical protein